jgi:outer membrane lipoprotein-sorting protein
MVFKRKLLIGCLSIATFISALTDKEVFTKALNLYNDESLHCVDFTQSNYWHEINTTRNSEGELIYSSNGVVINYIKPAKQMLRYNDENVTIVDYNEKTVLRMDNDGNIDFRPTKLIERISDSFSSADRKNNITTFSLNLKQDSELLFAECDIDSKFNITRINYTDIDSNRVEFNFSKREISRNDIEEKYKIKIPADFKVIQR